jgi:hypothetical protein
MHTRFSSPFWTLQRAEADFADRIAKSTDAVHSAAEKRARTDGARLADLAAELDAARAELHVVREALAEEVREEVCKA